MSHVKMICYRHVVLVLVGLVVLPGCAMISRSPAASTIMASLSYEVPASVDEKTLVDILEASSTRFLGKPMILDERSVATSPADAMSPVILHEKVTSLERLGKVVIPSIICPGALASMHAFIPSKAGLRLVAGCIVVDNSVTRVYLTDAITGEPRGSAGSNPSHEAVERSLIARIGGALTEQLPGIHPVRAPDILISRTSASVLEANAAIPEDSSRTEGETAYGNHDSTAHTMPLVCFAPKANGIAVSANPGSNLVVGRLDTELIVQDENPSRNSFLQITTREGLRGWVKRSDVRWTPCPIV
jgi:hypothetical protein